MRINLINLSCDFQTIQSDWNKIEILYQNKLLLHVRTDTRTVWRIFIVKKLKISASFDLSPCERKPRMPPMRMMREHRVEYEKKIGWLTDKLCSSLSSSNSRTLIFRLLGPCFRQLFPLVQYLKKLRKNTWREGSWIQERVSDM